MTRGRKRAIERARTDVPGNPGTPHPTGVNRKTRRHRSKYNHRYNTKGVPIGFSVKGYREYCARNAEERREKKKAEAKEKNDA